MLELRPLVRLCQEQKGDGVWPTGELKQSFVL